MTISRSSILPEVNENFFGDGYPDGKQNWDLQKIDMDDLRIYSRELTECEIKLLYKRT